MVETLEMKALEAVLAKARGLHPLRQARDRFAMELGNVPYNLVPLQMAGRTLAGEKQRIEGEIAKLHEKEQGILHELRTFFAALVKDATQRVQEKTPAVMSKRLRLRDLLAEAGVVYAEIEQEQKDWTNDLDSLRKVAAQLKNGIGDSYRESYPLPEISFPSPLVPSPNVQQAIRMRERGDNIAEILQTMAKQIG